MLDLTFLKQHLLPKALNLSLDPFLSSLPSLQFHDLWLFGLRSRLRRQLFDGSLNRVASYDQLLHIIHRNTHPCFYNTLLNLLKLVLVMLEGFNRSEKGINLMGFLKINVELLSVCLGYIPLFHRFKIQAGGEQYGVQPFRKLFHKARCRGDISSDDNRLSKLC